MDRRILGQYVDSTEYEFQTKVRELSLTIINDSTKPLHYNGWSTVLAVQSLLPIYANKLAKELVHLSHDICKEMHTFDLQRNVRGPVKKMLMYPLTEYPGWYDNEMETDITLNDLNSITEKYKLVIRENKLYCNLPKTKLSFQDDIVPHLTIINSNKLTDEHKKYNGIEIDDVKFTKLQCTYSFDYPPYMEVVVALVESPTLTNILKEAGIEQSLHLTIWRNERNALTKLV